jgi:hypothetical protein
VRRGAAKDVSGAVGGCVGVIVAATQLSGVAALAPAPSVEKKMVSTPMITKTPAPVAAESSLRALWIRRNVSNASLVLAIAGRAWLLWCGESPLMIPLVFRVNAVNFAGG